jgi:hypothetical protein
MDLLKSRSPTRIVFQDQSILEKVMDNREIQFPTTQMDGAETRTRSGNGGLYL